MSERQIWQNKINNTREKNQKKAALKTRNKSRKRCPKGKILRVAYTRNSSKPGIPTTYIAATCITDVGRPGKGLHDQTGKRIYIDLKKGILSRFNYHKIVNLTALQRKIRIGKAVRFYKNYLSIFRRLIFLSTLNKNIKPKLSKLYREDAEYVKKKFS